MATMNRNLNLEEVNSDAFMGIPYLNHQTMFQKGIFILSIIAAIAIMLIGTFALQWDVNASAFLALVPLLFGVAFGCNYNQDLSLIQYLMLMLFKPGRTYTTKPTEDVEHLHNIEARIRQEEALREQQEKKSSPEEQKKLLIILAVSLAAIIAIVVIALIVIKNAKVEEIHHTVSWLVEGVDWRLSI